jgi:hypothetical protein
MGTCVPGNGRTLLSCLDCTGTGPWSLHLLDTWRKKHAKIYCQLQSLHSVVWNSEQNGATKISSLLCSCLYYLIGIISHTIRHLSPIVLVSPCSDSPLYGLTSNVSQPPMNLWCRSNILDQDIIWWYVYLHHQFILNPAYDICIWEVCEALWSNTLQHYVTTYAYY